MKHYFRYVALLSVVASLSFAVEALPTTRGPMSFSVYDTNKDGVISEEEFYAVKAARMQNKADAGMPMRNAGNSPDFTFFDTNKDGKITPEELQKGQATQMQNRPKGMGRAQ
ncbi:MAG: EF-hand domain-containing protein [Sulfurospirillaceae bacterium]|jgi:hypothetical protein|nr:EF-hand domain-containing protein [Sulfurospirillaceae bacterium]MDD2825605.1 EF-hand domain-containing protein [Sulfurospirillaceae bacterium]